MITLNSISTKYAEIVIKHDPCNKLIKIYDGYNNDDATKKSFLAKSELYHSIEWKNYGFADESSNAYIKFTTHYRTKEGAGTAEKSTVCIMPYDCAKALFTHAEKIACLKSIIKK